MRYLKNDLKDISILTDCRAKMISESEYFDDLSWYILNKYFDENKNTFLVKHLIDTYNDFILQKIDQIIDGFNTIEMHNQYLPEIDDFMFNIKIKVSNPVMTKPTVYEKDGSTKIMTPSDARARNFTYAGLLYVDIDIHARTYNPDTKEFMLSFKTINGLSIGKVPIMVRSTYCVLNTLTQKRNDMDECIHDYGGYFIVNGNEKVVISQDRIAENKTYVFLNTKATTFSHIVEIRSVQDGAFSVPKITSVKLSSKANKHGRYMKVNIQHIKHDIPIFILFRALGIESDKDIMDHICLGSAKSESNLYIVNELIGSVDDGNFIFGQNDAHHYLLRYLNVNGHPREFMANTQYKRNLLQNVLRNEFLPHVGQDLGKKALYLGYMINKLIKCYLGKLPLDDRDSYINKRVDTPGILMANLFRMYYGKLIKDMRNMVQKEINNGSWKATNNLINVINKVNVSKIFKSTIIESGLKYGLSTGNWGIKSNKTKQGVAQILNRMTYNATISHLRRVNTPIEKSVKLVQPRKLHATQWGVFCPCETPEGTSVGLVKNLAMMTYITSSSCSVNVRDRLGDMGVVFTCNPLKASGKTFIFVNEDIVGYHDNPANLVGELRSLKMHGGINIFTSISWKHNVKEVHICTEGGRCVRPLFTITKNRANVHDIADAVLHKQMSWNEIVLSGAVEYVDVDETNSMMLAMTHINVVEANAKNIEYTHLEMHPSLVLGVLAGSIPFSDHNQAPRNTYQCLWEHEHVLMADGSRKEIKDVCIGDSIVTFDPQTMQPSYTHVINQYVRSTDKEIVKIVTETGREIIVTYDHLFMTNKGWLPAHRLMEDDVRVAVYNEWSTQTQFMLFQRVIAITQEVNCMIADITTESDNHSFIGGRGGFAVHNSAMGKQAIGLYSTNFRNRYDSVGHTLNYPQKPLVYTRTSKIVNVDKMPCGINAIVAIATYTGFNQEDSLIMNKSSIDRGMFQSTVYRTFKDQNDKNHSTGEEEVYCNPENMPVKQLKPYNYSKLDSNGFVPENTCVNNTDIIIGKCIPKLNKDMSVPLKNNETCFVDRNCIEDKYFTNTNGDGYTFSKVRTRSDCIPTIGDKFSSRMGQKGIVGMVYRQEDMPFTKDGLVPDIIMNPHAVPSRMTIGQLMECIMGKSCVMKGTRGDGTPFTGVKVEELADILESCGLERYGNEIMYNGFTGDMIETEIFMGPTYYQRLKHLVQDKVHCLTPDHEVLTDSGWKFFEELNDVDKVATLQEGKLVYNVPTARLWFPNYNGKVYDIQNQAIDLKVTMNHQMFVATKQNDYNLITAENIVGKHVYYKKDAEWSKPDYQFSLPSIVVTNTDAWIQFIGLWIVGGWTTVCGVKVLGYQMSVYHTVADVITKLGYDSKCTYENSIFTIIDLPLYEYMSLLTTRRLPSWIWELSQSQAQTLINAMLVMNNNDMISFNTVFDGLADDLTRLCLHAGWSGSKFVYQYNGDTCYCVHINKTSAENKPFVTTCGAIYDYSGPVWCLQVPDQVFYVRRNGKPVWTGNSRSNNGPVVMMTRQPTEGRARNGGLRLGEMEVECQWAHGCMQFTKECFMDCSDNFRMFICEQCGMAATAANPEKNIWLCKSCKNTTAFREIRIPYACKLLFQEVQAMNVAVRFAIE